MAATIRRVRTTSARPCRLTLDLCVRRRRRPRSPGRAFASGGNEDYDHVVKHLRDAFEYHINTNETLLRRRCSQTAVIRARASVLTIACAKIISLSRRQNWGIFVQPGCFPCELIICFAATHTVQRSEPAEYVWVGPRATCSMNRGRETASST